MIEEAKVTGDCVVRKSWDGVNWIGNNGNLKSGTTIWIDKALSHDGYTRTTSPIIGWIPSSLIGSSIPPPTTPPAPNIVTRVFILEMDTTTGKIRIDGGAWQ